ncbi:hypothetical protein ACPOL_6924 (plasmid) [Acidisarcina polymorpha]|uniref:Uncharacterized protein n=1 Tax=Acidisarcina polymorpha TaxID=2211140 RepID=A0A2Z5GB29_9BACT|nr:hypothetical protein ACPOL_6924 [Acidisarcina polymorpha]
MYRHGIASDDQIFNAVLVERGQEFFEVLTEHRGRVPSKRIALTTVHQLHPAVHAQGGFASTDTRRPSSRRNWYSGGWSCPCPFVAPGETLFNVSFRDWILGRATP